MTFNGEVNQMSSLFFLRAEKEGFQERIYPKGRERRAGQPRLVESLKAGREGQSKSNIRCP